MMHMLAFNNDMQARIEERKKKRGSDRNNKLALRAKQIESKKERDERNFRLREETAKKWFEVDQLREDRILRLHEQSLALNQTTPPTSDLWQIKTIKRLLTPLMLLKRLPILHSRIHLIKNGLLLF